MNKRKCKNCGGEYELNKKYSKSQKQKSKYCSKRCTKMANPLSGECRERIRMKLIGRKLTEEHKNKIRNSNTGNNTKRWKGGISSDGNGYLRNNKTKKRVHRQIIEEHIGRNLDRNEVVHHKNHNKLDNRLENLQVMTKSEHCKLHNPVAYKWNKVLWK